MKIAIIGTGGVGGYFGAKLARAGYDVTFLARGEQLKTMQTNGLKVKSVMGDFEVNDVKATDKIVDIEHPDLIIVCVKAWQIKEVRDDLNEIIHANTLILPLQNGILSAEELSEKIDQKHILSGLCRIYSKIESPGVINHFGITPSIDFGEINGPKTERLIPIQDMFEKAEIVSNLSDDMNAELWKKFISICTSGLLAVTKTTYGEMRELKATRKMMVDLLTEIYELSQKMGVNLETDYVEKTVAGVDSYPYESTSSLTRDVWEGKRSEIDYQNGTVVRLGEKHDVETPVNRFVYSCILPNELKARGLDLKSYDI